MQHFLADDGEKIHVHISGAGSPVIMLHGWTASHLEWSPFMRGLTPHHRIYRWDARGHGGHPLHAATEVTVARMARDLRNMIEHFGIETATIVGHSMGALTLWQYLHDFGTDRVNKLCFIDQSPRLLTDATWKLGIYGDFDAKRSNAFLNDLHHDFAETVLQLIAFGLNQRARSEYLANAPAWQSTRALFRALPPGPLIDCWRSLTAADYRGVLEHIDRPTLLIYGGESNFYLPDTARYVAESIKESILHIYEGEDHSPHMWQRERFVKDLLAFIA